MEQSAKVDKSKPLVEQFYEVLEKRFYDALELAGRPAYGNKHFLWKTARVLAKLAKESAS